MRALGKPVNETGDIAAEKVLSAIGRVHRSAFHMPGQCKDEDIQPPGKERTCHNSLCRPAWRKPAMEHDDGGLRRCGSGQPTLAMHAIIVYMAGGYGRIEGKPPRGRRIWDLRKTDMGSCDGAKQCPRILVCQPCEYRQIVEIGPNRRLSPARDECGADAIRHVMEAPHYPVLAMPYPSIGTSSPGDEESPAQSPCDTALLMVIGRKRKSAQDATRIGASYHSAAPLPIRATDANRPFANLPPLEPVSSLRGLPCRWS